MPAATAAIVPLQEQESWQLLLSHLALAQGFSLLVLTAPEERTLAEVRRALAVHLPPEKRAAEYDFQPYAPAGTLTEHILSLSKVGTMPACLWVNAPISQDDPAAADPHAWHAAFTHLNRHRNRLRSDFPATLILAGTPETLQALREHAPDLWSVRSAALHFASTEEFVAAQDSASSCLNDSLAAYRRSLLAAFRPYQELALDNFAAAEQACPDIWDIFVHPACASEHLRPEQMDATQRETPPRLPAQDLLPILAQDDHRRTVLLADPGMGKSTLVQSLVAHLASMIYSAANGRFGIHELLITLFLFVTAPVSANLMAKAALHLKLPSKAGHPQKKD